MAVTTTGFPDATTSGVPAGIALTTMQVGRGTFDSFASVLSIAGRDVHDLGLSHGSDTHEVRRVQSVQFHSA